MSNNHALKQPILGNTLLFLDTAYFRNYCTPQNEVNNAILKHAIKGELKLCTSRICIEEWRTQILSGFQQEFTKIISSHDKLKQNNWIASHSLERVYEKLRKSKEQEQLSTSIVNDFIKKYDITIFEYETHHMNQAWGKYFSNSKCPPYQEMKFREDIPDAWMCEAAKDAANHDEYKSLPNKVFLTDDVKKGGPVCALKGVYVNIVHKDLVKQIKLYDESQSQQDSQSNSAVITYSLVSNNFIPINTQSPLDSLLSMAFTQQQKDIWLRLLGFVNALRSPTHDSLESTVASVLKTEKETVSIQAKYLSSTPYLQDTGNHYIIKDEAIGNEASKRIISDIIKVTGLADGK